MTGKTYYIDPQTGDDSNDGLTPSRPLKTRGNREFVGGDTVLFKRGSVIRDVLQTCSGEAGAPVTYGAYGEGEKPVFMGSVSAGDADRWVEDRPSVWRFTGTLESEVCNLIFNKGESCGILRWEFEDLHQPGDWHYTAIGRSSAVGATGEEYAADSELYLFAEDNPGRAWCDIECVLWGQRRLVGGQRHIILENLGFWNSGVHGYHEYDAHDVVIRGCDFRFIGGAVWSRKQRIRFGNAVEFWDGACDVTVEGCLFDNIYDAAVTHQGGQTVNVPERIYFRNNLFVDCGLAAYECREPSRDIYFENNTCINSGGGFSMQGEMPPRQSDPYPQPVGYHVYIWMIDTGTQPGNVHIRNNIFCNSCGAAISAVIDPADADKFVLDHNCYWQTTGELLIQFSRLAPGKTWAEALESMVSSGVLPIREEESYSPSEFARYQAESGQDKNSRVEKPQLADEAGPGGVSGFEC